MASPSNRVRLTERDQQRLLDDFYAEIDDLENIDNFSGGEEDADVNEMIEDAIENEGGAGEIETAENTAEGEEPRKKKFKDLAEVLDESNYDHLPPQEKKTYTYAMKEMERKGKSVKWTTHKNMESNADSDDDSDSDDEMENVTIPTLRRPPGKRRASNVVHDNPGPCADAIRMDTPIEFWSICFHRRGFAGDCRHHEHRNRAMDRRKSCQTHAPRYICEKNRPS